MLWPLAHAFGWTIFGFIVGVDFVQAPAMAKFGVCIGLFQACFSWLGTKVVVRDRKIVVRNLIWRNSISIDDVRAVYRTKRALSNRVLVVTADGTRIMLPTPCDALWWPDSQHDEDVGRLCAAIALAETTSA